MKENERLLAKTIGKECGFKRAVSTGWDAGETAIYKRLVETELIGVHGHKSTIVIIVLRNG